MIIAIILLYLLPGLYALKLKGYYAEMTPEWKALLSILFDLIFTPIGIVLDFIKQFGNINIK